MQSKVVANFIINKFSEKLKNLDIFCTTTNNFTNSDQHGICFKPKVFYVVFAPLMKFQSRGFLAKD